MSGSSSNHLHTPPARRWRILTIVGFLAAAALLLHAAARPDWWSSDASRASLGLRSVTVCSGGASCTTGDLMTIDPQWGRIGLITWVASLLASALFIFSAATLAAARRPRWLGRTSLVAAITAMTTTALFYQAYPGYSGAELGLPIYLALAASLLGILTALTTLRAPSAPPDA
jgi:hypothetical protein